MHLLSWFDNRTLFSCQFILVVVFAVLFLSMRRSYPNFRGIGSIALSYMLGVPGITLLVLRSVAPDLLSIAIANLLLFASFTLFYSGILRFLDDNGSLRLVWLIDFVALAIIFFYSEVHPDLAPRIIAASLAIGLIRGLCAFKLFQHARGRAHVRLFGLTMAIYTFVSLVRGTYILVNGAPANYLQSNPVLTFGAVGNILYICLVGLFFMSMVNNRVLALVRSESEQDPLTGVLNRRGIERQLKIESKRIERSGGQLSIALIDIDFFKSINDTAGHSAGDIAIRQVTNTISAQLRAYDGLGRYGGDEFLLILPQIPGKDALNVLERIAQAARPLHWHGSSLPITLSIGITEATPGESIAAMVSRADKALYAAKHAGRDCCRLILRDFQMESTSLNSARFVA